MRVLFSPMRLTGHIRPLLPYAHELLRRGHEVLVSTPEKGGAIVREAGLAHVLSGFPNEDDLREIWDSLPKMPPKKAGETILIQLFAGRYPRAALPALRETVQSWKPDLIVRESMEFAAVIVAAETNIPIVRIAITNAEFEARTLHGAAEPVDLLRRAAGLHPDQGAAMLAAPAFTSFPPSLDGDTDTDTDVTEALLRVRTETQFVDPQIITPAWAQHD